MRSLLFVPVLLLACGQAGSGTSKTEPRTAEAFSAIEVGGGFELQIRQGSPPSVNLTGDDNLLPLYRTEVRDGVLHVDTTEKVRPKVGPKLEVVVSSLTRVGVSGAVSGSLTDLKGAALALDLSGAADLTLKGAVDSLKIEASGAADIDSTGLDAKVVEIGASGAGDLRVSATETLKVDVSGAADVKYKGDPKRVTKSISGVGSVSPL